MIASRKEHHAHKKEAPEITPIREDVFEDYRVIVAHVYMLLAVILCFHLSKLGLNIGMVRR